MSIDDWIADRCRRRMIWPIWPKAAGAPTRRLLLVSEEVKTVLESKGDDEWEERMGSLRADLEVFVTAKAIYPKYLFLLYPAGDAVWEIRSVAESPSIRVLGCFVQRDVFVATTCVKREDLGGWQSREWKAVKRRAKARWQSIFQPYNPKPGCNVHSLVSGAVNGKYFKTGPKK